ncbi:PREDICTED: capZ-interacting protein [Nanorana parkeri]|uniref:capZ-interacting protein n=1 Tax=Nanorana parkeri TaxID=125878 RepID=UPI0008548FDA|nr:PREDICTED: capZ-interacting protein [Nanorana parkeri]
MEGKSGESDPAEEAAPPSVAKLAGLFGDKVNSPRKEAPPYKPTRKKPPCSLPLFKPEVTNNGDEKVSPPHTQMPKIKVKSSPLIEKLQANLAFAPASFLPGPSPKSPGLKIMASPFNSPPSTPNSPGLPPRTSELEEIPVSFEQPPEGAPLASYTKVRTRGSLKRRPPSRRFRTSQSDLDFESDIINTAPKENGDKVEEEGVGGLKDTGETRQAESACETDTTSHDPEEKSPESAQDDPGKTEKETQNEEGSPSTAEEQREATPDTGVTDSAITKEETVNTEDDKDKPSDGQEKDESSAPSKSDADDNPEK